VVQELVVIENHQKSCSKWLLYSFSPLGACVSALPVTAQGYPITVGGGGTGGGGSGGAVIPTSGSNSVFSSITSTGGGNGDIKRN
jgi:hypothetical protein